ncbi:cytochrome P450 [Fomes fomentarius]|nr:cytochrome P450 [Fomes fomentarius]
MSASVYVLAIAAAVFAFYFLRIRATNPKNLPLPPGPKGLPFLGAIYDVPQDIAWRTFQDWGKKYGNLIYFHTFGKPIVVINSFSIAHDLLEKRSALYSCRPYVPMAGDVIGWNWALPIVPYGDKFKRHRKYLQEYLKKPRLPNYYPIQLKEVHRLLNDLLDDPVNYKAHIKRMAAGITMLMTYGHEVKTLDDHFVNLAERGVKTIEAVGAVGAHIVDLLPWLRFLPDWVPGAGFKRLPPGTREDLHAFLHTPFEQVKKQMAEGTAVPCYTATMLEETGDEEGVRSTAGITYSGGFDTTVSTMMTTMVCVVRDPIVQARVQAELDIVVGKDRLPTFSDRDKLPYLHCVITEAIRYASTTPVGVPHRLMEDDEYNGYFIPKGTMVMANTWAMLNDPSMYPEPEKFNPDRFLKGEGRTPQPDPRGPAFGFGRRICPGKDLAENTVWAMVANLFHVYRITPAVDEEGKAIPIPTEFEEHAVRHPLPFKCKITPRLPTSVNLVRQTALI